MYATNAAQKASSGRSGVAGTCCNQPNCCLYSGLSALAPSQAGALKLLSLKVQDGAPPCCSILSSERPACSLADEGTGGSTKSSGRGCSTALGVPCSRRIGIVTCRWRDGVTEAACCGPPVPVLPAGAATVMERCSAFCRSLSLTNGMFNHLWKEGEVQRARSCG